MVNETPRADKSANDVREVDFDIELEEELPVGTPVELKLPNVLNEISWSKSFFALRDKEMRKFHRFYHKKHYDPQDSGGTALDTSRDAGSGISDSQADDDDEWEVTLNIPTNTIDMAVLMLTGEQPVIEVLNRETTKASLNRAIKTEQFLYGMHSVNNVRQGRKIVKQAVTNALLYGWGVYKLVWDETRLPREKRLGGELITSSEFVDTLEVEDEDENFVDMPAEDFPLVLSAPFPTSIYGIPGGRDEPFKAVFQSVQLEWSKMLSLVPPMWHKNIVKTHTIPQEDGKEKRIAFAPGDKVNFVDFWREIFVLHQPTGEYRKQVWHAILVEDRFVKPPTRMPEYEYLPYTIFYSTEGTDPENGENMGLSFLYKVLEAVKNLEISISQNSRAIEQWSDPTVIIKSDEEAPPRFSKLSGAVNHIATRESVDLLKWQGSPPDTARMIDFWEAQVVEMAFPGPGMGKFGGESGLDTIAQQRAAMSKIMEPKGNAEEALNRLHVKAISLLQKFAPSTPIGVRGEIETDEKGIAEVFALNIKGQDTKGMRWTKSTLRARFPLDELQNAATANSMLATKSYSRKAVMRNFFHVRDVDKMWRQIKEEDAALDSGWIKMFQGIVQRKFEEADEKRKAAREAGIQGQGPVAGPPPPGGPIGPPPNVAPQGAPPVPQLPPGGAPNIGRGQPGSLEASQNQLIGDIAAGGLDNVPSLRDGAGIPPPTGGKGLSGFLSNVGR